MSRNGDRTSRPCAMLIRSILTRRSSSRYVSMLSASRRSSGFAPSVARHCVGVRALRPVVARRQQALAPLLRHVTDPTQVGLAAYPPRPSRRTAACARRVREAPTPAAHPARAGRPSERARNRQHPVHRHAGGKALITGEQLVPSITCQRDRDVLARHLVEQEGRHCAESPNGWSWCQTSRSTSSTASG